LDEEAAADGVDSCGEVMAVVEKSSRKMKWQFRRSSTKVGFDFMQNPLWWL
jgi:hypothetical protein